MFKEEPKKEKAEIMPWMRKLCLQPRPPFHCGAVFGKIYAI